MGDEARVSDVSAPVSLTSHVSLDGEPTRGLVRDSRVSVITLFVKGTMHRGEAAARCYPGDAVRYVPEPENEHDPQAVRIEVWSDRWSGPVVPGYVDRTSTGLVHWLLGGLAWLGVADGPHGTVSWRYDDTEKGVTWLKVRTVVTMAAFVDLFDQALFDRADGRGVTLTREG
jgi:hypothetical protein